MGTLQVSLIADLGNELNALGVPIPLELIDSSSRIVERTTIRLSHLLDLPVNPGWYLVRAHLPSGEHLSQSAYVAESDEKPVSVVLVPSFSQQKWLAWPHFLGSDPIILGAATEPSTPLSLSESGTVSFPRARLWRATWQPLPPKPHLSWATENKAFMPIDQPFSQRYMLLGRTGNHLSFTLDFTSARQSLFMLEIEGAQLISHFIVLPPTIGKVQVTVSALTSEGIPSQGAFAIQVMSQLPVVEMLLRYLRTGAFHEASLLEGDVLLSSPGPEGAKHGGLTSPREERTDLSDPMYAIVGGYYLLRLGSLEQFHHWSQDYANRFSWIPDIAIIEAWQLLQRADGEEDFSLASNRLIEAADLGAPIFTEGLRLLLDGLEMFARQAQDGKLINPAVTSALSKVRNYADAMTWNQQLSTFTGSEPAKPSLLWTEGALEVISATTSESASTAPGRQRFTAGILTRMLKPIIPYVLLLPGLILVLLLVIYPMIDSLLLSFLKNPLGPSHTFIGLENYTYVLTDRLFQFATATTILFGLTSAALEITIGLGIALLMKKTFPARSWAFAVIFMPWAVPTVLSAQMWSLMYNGQTGIITNLLQSSHLLAPGNTLMSSPEGVIIAALIADAWKMMPFMTFLFLTGLRVIPDQVYEAATIEGASRWRQLWFITIPMLRTQFLIALLFRSLDAVRVFDLFYVFGQHLVPSMASYAFFHMFGGTTKDFASGIASSVVIALFGILICFSILICFNYLPRMRDMLQSSWETSIQWIGSLI